MVEQAFGSLVTSGITGSEALPNESFDRLEEKRKSSKKNKEHACPGSCTNNVGSEEIGCGTGNNFLDGGRNLTTAK